VCDPCQEGDNHAQGYPTCTTDQRGESLSSVSEEFKKKTQKINKKNRVLLNPPKTVCLACVFFDLNSFCACSGEFLQSMCSLLESSFPIVLDSVILCNHLKFLFSVGDLYYHIHH
jgi:hypothetical protein